MIQEALTSLSRSSSLGDVLVDTIISFVKDFSVQFSFIPDILFYIYCAIFVIAVVVCNLSLFFSFNGRSGPAFTELLFSSGIACGALPAGIYFLNDKFTHFNKWAVIIVIIMLFPYNNIIPPVKTLMSMNKIPQNPENLEDSSKNENIANIVRELMGFGNEMDSLEDDGFADDDSVENEANKDNNEGNDRKKERIKKKKKTNEISKNIITPKKRLVKRHRK